MAGWTCKDRENIFWDGTINSNFKGTTKHTPTEHNDIVNKEYVDSVIPEAINLFLTENASDLGGVYLDMEVSPVTDTEENILTAIPANSTGTLMASFATLLADSVIGGIVELPVGVYAFHIHCQASSAAKLSMYAELYHRTAGGTETLLLTSEDSNLIPIAKGSIAFHGTLTTEKDWVSTDRIVVKLYGKNNSAAARNLTIYTEGDTASRAALPAVRGSTVGGTPAGSNEDIQFNSSGSFGADSDLYWDVGRQQLTTNLIKITSDGTQAAPALKFNDTNTGFYKSGDSVSFSLNNSTKMTIDATGVGIGRTPTGVNLEVAGKIHLIDDGFSPEVSVRDDSSNFGTMKWESGSNYLYFTTTEASTEYDTLTLRSGDVGIGTPSPGDKLEVSGGVTAEKFRTFTGTQLKAHATYHTVFAAENARGNSWLINSWITGSDSPNNYHLVDIVTVANNIMRITNLQTSGSMLSQVSGLNYQIRQTSGVNQTLAWSAVRLGNHL